METTIIPNLKCVLIQNKYLETFMSCGDTLRNLFPRERIAGINTTATKVMQKMTELDRSKVHPDILRLCDLLIDATCSMEKEYLSYKNDNVDINAVNRQRKQLMKPKQIYGQFLANDFTKRIENLKHLVEDHKKIIAHIESERKVYQNLQSNISVHRQALYNIKNNSSAPDDMEVMAPQQRNKCFSIAMLKHHGATAENVFKKVQRLLRKENEIYKTMKDVENDVANKMKSHLYDRLIDGLSDMQVIGLDPSVSKKSSARILKKVTELDKDFDKILYNIISTGCQRYACASLLPEIDTGATNEMPEKATDNPTVTDTSLNKEYLDDTICSTAKNATEYVNQTEDENTTIGTSFEFKLADEDLSADDKSIGAKTRSQSEGLETDDITLNLEPGAVSCQPSVSQLAIEERTIVFNNAYVQPKEVQHEDSFLARMKGKKIKQKVSHIENIAFGWVRSRPWSLKKRWGFFSPEDVTCLQ